MQEEGGGTTNRSVEKKRIEGAIDSSYMVESHRQNRSRSTHQAGIHEARGGGEGLRSRGESATYISLPMTLVNGFLKQVRERSRTLGRKRRKSAGTQVWRKASNIGFQRNEARCLRGIMRSSGRGGRGDLVGSCRAKNANTEGPKRGKVGNTPT